MIDRRAGRRERRAALLIPTPPPGLSQLESRRVTRHLLTSDYELRINYRVSQPRQQPGVHEYTRNPQPPTDILMKTLTMRIMGRGEMYWPRARISVPGFGPRGEPCKGEPELPPAPWPHVAARARGRCVYQQCPGIPERPLRNRLSEEDLSLFAGAGRGTFERCGDRCGQ